MGINLKEISMKIYMMEKANTLLRMDHILKVFTKLVKGMEKVFFI